MYNKEYALAFARANNDEQLEIDWDDSQVNCHKFSHVPTQHTIRANHVSQYILKVTKTKVEVNDKQCLMSLN